MAQFVIKLKSGSYWIGKNEATGLPVTTGNPDAAQKFDSRWLALREMAMAGGSIMHEGMILEYLRPSERAKSSAEASS